MKKLIAFLACLPTTVMAQSVPSPENVYRPFIYYSRCALVVKTSEVYQYDNCKIIETREKGGALRTRNIFSNKWKLTIKGRFDKKQGYMTWDNYNNREYKWDYRINTEDRYTIGAWTYVMPGVMLENVSWD